MMGPMTAPKHRLAIVRPTNAPRLLTPQSERLTGDINTFFVPRVKAMIQFRTIYKTNLHVSSPPFLTRIPMQKKQMGDRMVTNVSIVLTVKTGPIINPTINLDIAYTKRNANDDRVCRSREAPNTALITGETVYFKAKPGINAVIQTKN